ncbi:hypothetical protein T484DRAFT_1841546 [Baffinella frigidus]|nr:hypothetical protein T484DRAFT_1841546 [Cryptophyta sp. CCMP2293]
MASMRRSARRSLGEEFVAARQAAIRAREEAAKLIRHEDRASLAIRQEARAMEQPLALTQAAPLRPSMASRRLKILRQGESPLSEASFAFGGNPPGLPGRCPPRARLIRRLPAPEDATAPSSRALSPSPYPFRTYASSEHHSASDDNTEEEARGITRSLSPSFVGTSERREVLDKLEARLSPIVQMQWKGGGVLGSA